MKTKKVRLGKHDAVEILHGGMKLAVVTDMGPRIAWFGPARGGNLLFWDADDKYARGDWKLKGGHRVWITRPGADECEESYAADNRPVEVREKAGAITFTSAAHPIHRVRRGFTLRFGKGDALTVENFVTNASDMLWSGGVWALTCTEPAGGATYGIPLGDGSEWDSFTVAVFKRWGGGHTSLVNDPQIRWTEDMLLLTPKGREAKRALFVPSGAIGMRSPREKRSFFKSVTPVPGGQYPCGCNIAFYVGPKNFMVEMETMSPEHTLKPGSTLVSVERWALTRMVDWKNAAAVRDAAGI